MQTCHVFLRDTPPTAIKKWIVVYGLKCSDGVAAKLNVLTAAADNHCEMCIWKFFRIASGAECCDAARALSQIFEVQKSVTAFCRVYVILCAIVVFARLVEH